MLQTFDLHPSPRHRPAVVSKGVGGGYLRLEPSGVTSWVEDPALATTFESMRDATRMALRLPAGMRAFGMLLQIELETYKLEHLH
jgi:hypothetical protein